jgi:hypothetical protein
VVIIDNLVIREFETKVVLSAYRNHKILHKLRPLQNLDHWYNSNAKTVLFKLLQNKPITTLELEQLGEHSLPDYHIDGAVEEILEADYINRVDRWLENINTAKVMNDTVSLDKFMMAKPVRANVSNYSLLADGLVDLETYVAETLNGTSQSIKHPFLEVRAILGDIGPGLHIIAGLPGSAKSAFVEQIELSISSHHKCGVFSLEMPKRQKLARYAQHLNGPNVGPKAINSGLVDTVLFKEAADVLRTKKIYVDDRPENIVQLIDSMELLEIEESPDYYSVDFLQVLNPLNGETDYQSIKNNIKQLYTFAKRYSKPIYVLSQLNRESDKQEFSYSGKKIEKLPKMRDLEGAGTIEQVAQNITFVQQVEDNDSRRIYIAKNRDGESPYDMGNVTFNGEYMNYKFSLNSVYRS